MKFILGIIFGVLVVIFIFQNTQVVDVSFLAWTITTSRALMVLVILAMGIALGWIVGSIRKRRVIAKQEKKEK